MNSAGLVHKHEAIGCCIEGCGDCGWLEVPCDGKGREGEPKLVVVGDDVRVN